MKKLPKIKIDIKYSVDSVTLMHNMLEVMSARTITKILLNTLITTLSLLPFSDKNYEENLQTLKMLGYLNKHWDELLPKAEKYFKDQMDKSRGEST